VASETLKRLVAIDHRVAALEEGQTAIRAELEGVNARLDLVVERLDQNGVALAASGRGTRRV